MSLPRLPTNCPRCDGSGRVTKTYARGRGMTRSTVSEPCPRCHGSGIVGRVPGIRRHTNPSRPKKRGHATKKSAIKAGKASIRALEEDLASTHGIVPQLAWDAIGRGGDVPAEASRMYNLARRSPQGVDLTRAHGVSRNPSKDLPYAVRSVKAFGLARSLRRRAYGRPASVHRIAGVTIPRTHRGAGRRPFAKAWRPAKNPLTTSETSMARSWGARFARYARQAPTKTDRARNYALASGVLKAACFFGRGRGVGGACRAQSRMLGRSMRATMPRAAARRFRRNPLLQAVLPNPVSRRQFARALRRARAVLRAGAPSRKHDQVERVLRDLGQTYHARRSYEVSGGRVRDMYRNPAVRGYAARGGSRVKGDQRLTVKGFASLAEARNYPGFAAALALHKKFHGRAPVHLTKVRIEDGQPHTTRKAVVMIGEAPAIEYRTWRNANSVKSHTKDGRRIVWRHKMGEHGGKPAYYVHDPASGVTSLLGGTYRVRDFYYH